LLLELSKFLENSCAHNYGEYGDVLESLSTRFDRNDLFSTERDRLPLKEATDPRRLEAFAAFGSLMVVAFCTGHAIPFVVSRVVIRYGFDCPLIDDDFEDCPDRALDGIRGQLDAVRAGVLKMRPIANHDLFELDFFPRVVQMMPFVDFLRIITQCPLAQMYTVFKGVCTVVERLRTVKVRWTLDKARLEYKPAH
jgi:hypothetical protein